MKYRTKPVEVEAVRFTGDIERMQGFCGCRIVDGAKLPMFDYAENWIQVTDPSVVAVVYSKWTRRWLPVRMGDWIVRIVDGYLYPFKDEWFRERYELVTNERR